MDSTLCHDLVAYFKTAEPKTLGQPPRALIEHIETCSACQVALLAFCQTTTLPSGEAIDCDTCQAQLEAFFEAETLDPQYGQAWYPEIWAHLWTCSNCLETYELLHSLTSSFGATLQVAAATMPSMPISLAQQLFSVQSILQIQRRSLQAALPASFVRRSMYQQAPNSYEITEGATASLRYSITAKPRSATQWQLQIELDPPPIGTIVVTIDDYRVVAQPTNATMLVADIPSTYLINPEAGLLSIVCELSPVDPNDSSRQEQ